MYTHTPSLPHPPSQTHRVLCPPLHPHTPLTPPIHRPRPTACCARRFDVRVCVRSGSHTGQEKAEGEEEEDPDAAPEAESGQAHARAERKTGTSLPCAFEVAHRTATSLV
jgi:hypothetical protein